jgi:hypothetical protein
VVVVQQRTNVNRARPKSHSREVLVYSALIRLCTDYLHEDRGQRDAPARRDRRHRGAQVGLTTPCKYRNRGPRSGGGNLPSYPLRVLYAAGLVISAPGFI